MILYIKSLCTVLLISPPLSVSVVCLPGDHKQLKQRKSDLRPPVPVTCRRHAHLNPPLCTSQSRGHTGFDAAKYPSTTMTYSSPFAFFLTLPVFVSLIHLSQSVCITAFTFLLLRTHSQPTHQFYFCVSVHRSISQMKHQLDATLYRFYFCRVTLHVSDVKRPSSGVLKNWHGGP